MIDTVKFKIKCSESQFNNIKNRSVEITGKDNSDNTTKFRIYKTNINLGSFDKHINLFIDDSYKDEIRLELSLPKYFYGHNVFLVYFYQLEEILQMLHRELVQHFNDFPHYHSWQFMRIDLCYAWKYQTEAHAEIALEILRSFKYPRKKIYLYETSIMHVGTAHSLKFYLKNPEYFKNDFKTIKKMDIDLAYDILNFSQGVLRFEVTLRKRALLHYFGYNVLKLRHLNNDLIYSVLKHFFNNLIKLQPKLMTSTEIYNKLLEYYTPTKSVHLLQFYKLFHSENQEDQKILKQSYTRQQIWYNLKLIKDAGIGLPKRDIDYDFDLNIPSDYVPNHDKNGDVAPATDTSDQFIDIDDIDKKINS